MSCIETLLNQAYERNAVLESEVDEIENLRVKLQRANDEARGNYKLQIQIPWSVIQFISQYNSLQLL